jgi:Rrf2 family transcriptional regulator, cysteine metabolism repressor
VKVSAKEQYGLRAMAELSRQYGAGPISLNEVAQAQDISLDYLEQVIPALRDAGLLNSKRGAKGGYELARSPEQITIGQILRALDGDILPVQCVGDECKEACVRTNECGARTVWQAVHDQLLDTLDGMVLADL